MVEKIAEMIIKAQRTNKSIIQSFHAASVRTVQKKFPSIQVGGLLYPLEVPTKFAAPPQVSFGHECCYERCCISVANCILSIIYYFFTVNPNAEMVLVFPWLLHFVHKKGQSAFVWFFCLENWVSLVIL